jgi:hypothetical protein
MGLAGLDTSRLSTFSAAVAADPVLITLRDKVMLDFCPGIANTFTQIDLSLQGGSQLTAQHDAGLPATDVSNQGRRLEAKFAALVDPVLGADKTAELIAAIRHLDSLNDVREIMNACAG